MNALIMQQFWNIYWGCSECSRARESENILHLVMHVHSWAEWPQVFFFIAALINIFVFTANHIYVMYMYCERVELWWVTNRELSPNCAVSLTLQSFLSTSQQIFFSFMVQKLFLLLFYLKVNVEWDQLNEIQYWTYIHQLARDMTRNKS